MLVEGNSTYVDIEHNGKKARFWGELGYNGFLAAASSMKWLPPHDGEAVTDDERAALIREVKKHFRWCRYKVTFFNDKGKKIRWRIK
jgi:hypothetical protein